jgi:hypothetical protein
MEMVGDDGDEGMKFTRLRRTYENFHLPISPISLHPHISLFNISALLGVLCVLRGKSTHDSTSSYLDKEGPHTELVRV